MANWDPEPGEVTAFQWEGGFPLDVIEPGQKGRESTVAEVLPDGYARYVRVFHPFLPADPANPEDTLSGPARTWRSLADEAGAAFDSEPRSEDLLDALGGPNEEHRPWWTAEGRLRDPARSALHGLLADRSPEATFLYDLAAVMWTESNAPLVYRAPTSAVAAVQARAADAMHYHGDDVPSPEFVWPDDRSWVVNTDYDSTSTYVACAEELARAILGHPDLEALLVTRQTRVRR